MRTWLAWLPAAAAVLAWLVGPLAPAARDRVREAAGPVAFQLLDWETRQVAARLPTLWAALVGAPDEHAVVERELLVTYFALDRTRRTQLQAQVEPALERLVGGIFERAGIPRSQPLQLRGEQLFPPVLIALIPPPNVLVLAPRTELRVLESVVLNPMPVAEQERLEAPGDSTGISALVAPIGGLATYPAMILDDGSSPPRRILAAVAHEWLHHYLVFYPLGASYWASQEAREINETAADIVGEEVATLALAELGVADSAPVQGEAGGPLPAGRDAFDFRTFMRETRLEVERLLAAGQVEPAEAYMRERRDVLQTHGYAIRKLNQAYFALYGSYGGGFAASPRNPVPGLLRELRARRGSLAEFVFAVRELRSVADLRSTLGGG